MIIDLESIGESRISLEDFEDLIRENNPFTLQIPLPSINSSNSYLDIVADYLDASFILESLAQIADLSDLIMVWTIKHHPVYHVKILASDLQSITKKLLSLSFIFFCDDNEDDVALREDIWEFEDNLDEHEFKFPEVIDDYYANLVTGAYYELQSETPEHLERILVKYPERKFGFWLTPLSRQIGKSCYLSVHTWIVPIELELNSIYQLLYGHPQPDIEFLPGKTLFVNQIAYALNDSVIVHLPFSHFLKAKVCAEALVDTEISEIMYETAWLDRLFSYYSRGENAFVETNEQLQCLISELGDIVVIQDREHSYFLFNSRKLNQIEKLKLYDNLSKAMDFIGFSSGMGVNVACDWEQLDDEQFEQLCYDIIYYNPKFDTATIRKMGKSRSRDGGRDIEVHTRSRPGYLPEKYIFQCKLLTTGSSLTGKKLGSVSDVIDQYGAKGYGVMTNVVIDSTLYDRFDAIQQNRGLEFDHWSVFELERFLARHPSVKKRYFYSDSEIHSPK